MGLRATTSLLIAASALTYCGAPLPTGPDGSASDASSDVEVSDVSSDALADAASDADAQVTFTYLDPKDQNNWESFDVLTWSGSPPLSFFGAAFDGHYIYYVPNGKDSNGSSLLVRYDTTMPFTSPSSWEKFDLSTMSSALHGFVGAVFAKNTLYLMPRYTSTFARFDTTATFSSTGSYQNFDSATATSSPFSFAGGAFDGQFIYPDVASLTNGFRPVRYDTTQSFTSKASWSEANVTTQSDAKYGAVFDGRFVYYAPTSSSIFRRYDTTQPFTNTGSWEAFPSQGPISSNAYLGSVFDGRYIYFVGYAGAQTSAATGLVLARYDTQQPFTADASWTYMFTGNATSVSSPWCGLVFDGRYIFLIQMQNNNNFPVIGRYDTLSNAYSDASAPGFDTISLFVAKVPYSSTYQGGAYDGQYLYLAPSNGPALRFKTKTPAQMPASYHGSFF